MVKLEGKGCSTIYLESSVEVLASAAEDDLVNLPGLVLAGDLGVCVVARLEEAIECQWMKKY